MGTTVVRTRHCCGRQQHSTIAWIGANVCAKYCQTDPIKMANTFGTVHSHIYIGFVCIRIIISSSNNCTSICVEKQHIDLSKAAPTTTACSRLVQWSSISWSEYSQARATQPYVDESIVSAHDLLYRAVLQRASAKLECCISISANFPASLPIWSLELTWKGKQSSALNNTNIRVISVTIMY